MSQDDQREIRDTGGVPRTLMVSGYRSVSPVIGVTAALLLIIIIGSVIWSVIGQPHASAAGNVPQRVLPTPNTTNPQSVVPDPTDPPLRGVPRTRSVLSIATHPPIHATSNGNSAQTQPLGPPGETAVQLEAAADVRRLNEASNASARMQLDTQGEVPQNATVSARTSERDNVPFPENHANTVFVNEESTRNAPHNAFLGQQSGNPGYEAASSLYELVTGTIIPARLVTAIDSTVPGGLIKAVIIESIFDSKTHSVVVVPQGTIAIGHSDQAMFGEARLVAAWTEFYLPNGRKFFASSNEGAGAKGEAGMSVSVDTHAGRAFGNAFVGAVLQAGVNQASRATKIDISTTSNTSQSQRLAPTLHAYPGQLFNIILNHDLPLDRYEPAGQ